MSYQAHVADIQRRLGKKCVSTDKQSIRERYAAALEARKIMQEMYADLLASCPVDDQDDAQGVRSSLNSKLLRRRRKLRNDQDQS